MSYKPLMPPASSDWHHQKKINAAIGGLAKSKRGVIGQFSVSSAEVIILAWHFVLTFLVGEDAKGKKHHQSTMPRLLIRQSMLL